MAYAEPIVPQVAAESMTAYYNEIDPYAAAWLRNLIAAGHIADGVVDERSIVDVQPEDLAGFAQVHFFAGLGGWSHAARLAGWPDDRPLWTGSCPCQPFSAAGKRGGTADERHLWPEMHRLVAALRPPVVVGEQVASRAGLEWLDGVCADLEGAGYATGAIDLCAAGVGAPHIRQRLWWVAYADGRNASPERLQRSGKYGQQPQDGGAGRRMAYARGEGWGQIREDTRGGRGGSSEAGMDERSMHGGTLRGMAQARGAGLEVEREQQARGQRETVERGGETDFWSDADWIPCRDGKARPVEPGSFPLAHGIPARVGRLRAYGNAIVPQIGAEILRAYLACK